MTGRMLKLMGASAAIAIVASAAQADTWRYATEEAAANDVQNVFAQKFKEEIEANSDH
jgi:TRAP-type C4-dicarboxylate transport system substrate-binding protein